MAEEKLDLRGINWQETFGFTHVFRSFRLAIHPSKLVLAFVGLTLCVLGGFGLDRLWYGGDAIIWKEGAPEEIRVFAARGERGQDFKAWSESQSLLRENELTRRRKKVPSLDTSEISIKSASIVRELIDAKQERLKQYLEENSLDKEKDKIDKRYPNDADKRRVEKKKAEKEIPEKLLDKKREVYRQMESIRDLVGKGPGGRGPFRALLRYELGVFDKVVSSVTELKLLEGLKTTGDGAEAGVIVHLWRGLKGLQWMYKRHRVYFMLFGIYCLVVWSIFGGAISRTAALHVARGEKISIKEALNFGVKKFPSFLFAPLIPVAIVAALVAIVLVGSFLLGNLGWGIGEVLVSVLMFLSLIVGFIMALVSVGTVSGLNLMYPTIAVEGSDSFDAISRSFSYIYARPWRTVFYSLVALVYGVLCYLFVRFFAFLVLKMTHISVAAGISSGGAASYGLTDKFTSMWPGPQFFGSLHGGFDWASCQGAQTFGASIIFLWVCVIIGFVAAFLVSFFFSANTVIYYLLRSRVDSTDMDDVYVDEDPEDQIPPVTPAPEPAKNAEADKPEAAEKTDESSEKEPPSEDK